jgi:hypothetical protein
MKRPYISLVPVLTASFIAIASKSADAQIFGGEISSGVYTQSDGQGVAGVFDDDEFHGIMVGPNGKVRRFNHSPNPFRKFFGKKGGNGVVAGAAAGTGLRLGPDGFDPFDFVFGGAASSGGAARLFTQPPHNSDIDAAKAAFRGGCYDDALRAAQRLVGAEEVSAEAFQLEALCHFAVRQYEAGAAAAYEALRRGTRWKWATLRAMYPETSTYLAQFRELEAAAGRATGSSATHFLLAYHYLMLDKSDHARAELELTARLQPQDQLVKELLDSLPPQIDAVPNRR